MIRLNGLVYAVGAFRLEVSLDIGPGEYFVIMGPTGSGKTALAECLAGLRRPQSGRIEIAERDVTDCEPRHRAVGYVPQDYALFPHRTVRRNLAFGPEVRGWSREMIERAVRESAERTGMEHLLDRRIAGLSGGERQRVALARALAMRPQVLILDEPVSSLDEFTRESVCRELRRLQRDLNITTLHISHNLEEAFSVADRAAVMRDGRVEQVDRMENLLRRPRNEFVARFMRSGNILRGFARGPGPGESTIMRLEGIEVVVPGTWEGAATLVLRPEHLRIARPGTSPDPAAVCLLTAPVARAVDRGAYVRLELGGPCPLVAHVPPVEFSQLGIAEGGEVRVAVRPESIHVFSDPVASRQRAHGPDRNHPPEHFVQGQRVRGDCRSCGPGEG